MIKIDIFTLYYPDVQMYKCNSFIISFTAINLFLMIFVLIGFLFSRKRLGMPFILFYYAQMLFFMSLTNALKDDCLANFLSTFDSYGFFRIANYLIGYVETSNNQSFLSLYIYYDFLLYNLFDIFFYSGIMVFFYISIGNIYIMAISFNYLEGSLRRRVKSIISLFTFSVPLKLFELMYFPLCFIMMMGFYNSSLGDAWNIIIFIVIVIICMSYLFFTNTILTNYFGVYLKTSYLTSFGALYSHLNFVDMRTIGKMIRQGKNDDYMLYRFINMIRADLTFRKIFSFFLAMLIVYLQNTNGVFVYIIIMCIIVLQTALFLVLKVKNSFYYYNGMCDQFYIWMQIILFLNALVLLIASQSPLSLQFSSIFLIFIDMLFYIVLLIGTIIEMIKNQDNDILWKIKNNKKEKIEKKNEFIKLLSAEVIDSTGKTADRKIVRKIVTGKQTDKSQIEKSKLGGSTIRENKTNRDQPQYNFIASKYK